MEAQWKIYCKSSTETLQRFEVENLTMFKIYGACKRFVVEALLCSSSYGMEVLKFVEELDHEKGNLHHKCKLTIVNDLSHWFITLSKS
jgi:hypothetical protein